MRISTYEQRAICQVLREVFGEDAEILLFGSRTDDQRRGGDIDLYVEADLPRELLYRKELEALRRLETVIGEQRIDLLIRPRCVPLRAHHTLARRTGIPLL